MRTGKQFRDKFRRHMPAVFPLLAAFILLLSLSFSKKPSAAASCRLMAIDNAGRIASLLERSAQRIERSDCVPYERLLSEYDSARSCYAAIGFFVEYYSAFDAAHFIDPKSEYDSAGFRSICTQLHLRNANVNRLLKDYRLLSARFRDLQKTYGEIEIKEPQIIAALDLYLQQMKRSAMLKDKYVDHSEQELFMNSLTGISETLGYFGSDAYYSLLLEESNKTLDECMNKVVALNGQTTGAAYFCSEIIDPVIAQITQVVSPGTRHESEKVNYLLSQWH